MRVCLAAEISMGGNGLPEDMSASCFFNSVEDHLLALLFSHLPGVHLAWLAIVCPRWREIVQGPGSDDTIWKVLWKRDFVPYILDSPASTVEKEFRVHLHRINLCVCFATRLASPYFTTVLNHDQGLGSSHDSGSRAWPWSVPGTKAPGPFSQAALAAARRAP